MTTSECSHVEALKAELLAAERREQALKARLDAAEALVADLGRGATAPPKRKFDEMERANAAQAARAIALTDVMKQPEVVFAQAVAAKLNEKKDGVFVWFVLRLKDAPTIQDVLELFPQYPRFAHRLGNWCQLCRWETVRMSSVPTHMRILSIISVHHHQQIVRLNRETNAYQKRKAAASAATVAAKAANPPPPARLQVLSYDHTKWESNTANCVQTTIELDGRPVVFCRVPGQTPGVQYVTSVAVQPPALRANVARERHCTVRVVDGGKVQVEGAVYAPAKGAAAGTTSTPIPYWIDGAMVTGTRLLSQGQTVEFRGRLVNAANPSEVLKRDLIVMSFKVA